jgi:hypothetical protein
LMHAGPWTDRKEAYAAWGRWISIPRIDGKRPVAIERRSDSLRLLYEVPHGREPLPVSFGLPEYAAQ